MSSPRAPERRASGFTLLECMVALLALTLLATGIASLLVAHDRLVQGLGTWAAGDPVWFVARPGPTGQALGAPARLSAEAPVAPPAPDPGPLEVTVLSVTRGLAPASATAQVLLEDA